MDNKIKDFFINQEKSINIPEFKYKKLHQQSSIRFEFAFYALIIIMAISINFTSPRSIITKKTGDNLENNKEKIFSAIKESTVYFYNKEDI